MRRFTFVFPLLFTLCFGYEAQAQHPDVCGFRDSEVLVVINDPAITVTVTVYNEDGTIEYGPESFTQADAPDIDLGGNCVLLFETDGTGGGVKAEILTPDKVLTFEFSVSGGSGSGSYTYQACGLNVDPVDGGFYCPPKTYLYNGIHDLFFIFDEGLHVVPYPLRDSFGPNDNYMGIYNIILQTAVLPYDNLDICVSGVNCPGDFDKYAVFLTG